VSEPRVVDFRLGASTLKTDAAEWLGGDSEIMDSKNLNAGGDDWIDVYGKHLESL
jgi:hypothetical protein